MHFTKSLVNKILKGEKYSGIENYVQSFTRKNPVIYSKSKFTWNSRVFLDHVHILSTNIT